MIKRVIDISEASYLYIKHQQLIIERQQAVIAKLAVEDLGVLILQHPAIVITQAVILNCQQNNVAIIFCDNRHLPYSVILPLVEGHTLHSKIIKEQTAVAKTVYKRIWKQVVVNKILHQALVIDWLGKDSCGLKRLAERVKTDDKENHEAQAAQKYWRLLFGNEFRRDQDATGVNAVLNYGYAIIRAAVARAIVATGLHPALGIHHKNQYNGLCLADDLMEPLRPWIDWKVQNLYYPDGVIEINQETKKALLQLLAETVNYKGKSMPLMVSLQYLLADYKQALSNSNITLQFPRINP